MAVSDFRPLLDDEVLPLRRRVARVAGCPASQLLPQRNAILYRPRARPGRLLSRRVTVRQAPASAPSAPIAESGRLIPELSTFPPQRRLPNSARRSFWHCGRLGLRRAGAAGRRLRPTGGCRAVVDRVWILPTWTGLREPWAEPGPERSDQGLVGLGEFGHVVGPSPGG